MGGCTAPFCCPPAVAAADSVALGGAAPDTTAAELFSEPVLTSLTGTGFTSIGGLRASDVRSDDRRGLPSAWRAPLAAVARGRDAVRSALCSVGLLSAVLVSAGLVSADFAGGSAAFAATAGSTASAFVSLASAAALPLPFVSAGVSVGAP